MPKDKIEQQQWLADIGVMGRAKLRQEAEGWWETLTDEDKKKHLKSIGSKKDPTKSLPLGIDGQRMLLVYQSELESNNVPLMGGVPYQKDSLSDFARSERREKASKLPKPTFGDTVETASGEVGVFVTSGGMFTNRAKVELPDGTVGWHDLDLLIKVEKKHSKG